jgi:hypothetical protein
MRSQKCTECGTLLDVTKLEKGAKFACANCGTILVVGEAVAVKRSLTESGPAFKPKTGGKEQTAQPARRRRAPADERAPESKSAAPLYIGIGLLVVVLIVVGVVVSKGGGGGSGGAGGGSRTTVTKMTPQEWWVDVSPAIASAQAAELREILDEAKARRYDQDLGFWAPKANLIYTALLAKSPESKAANRYFGKRSLRAYPGFKALWEEMDTRRKLLPKQHRDFMQSYGPQVDGEGAIWMDKETYASAEKLLDSCAAWLKKLKEDPSAELVQKGRDHAVAEMKGYDAAGATALPYVLLFGFRKSEAGDIDAQRSEFKAKAEKYTPVLRVVLKEFEERFRKPLDLPAPDPRAALYVWVFDNVSALVEFRRSNPGFTRNVEMQGYFRPRSRWVYGALSDDASVARFLGQDLGCAAVQQLQWLYSKDPKKKWGENYFEEWNGLWFTVGLSAWLGGGVEHSADTGEASWTGFDRRWVDHLKLLKDNGIPLAPLTELTQVLSWEGFQRWAGDSYLPMLRDDEDLPDNVMEVVRATPNFVVRTFFSQCWYMAHFLNEFEGGKYRKKYVDLLMTALRGKRKPKAYAKNALDRWRYSYGAFAEIMGLKSDADWEKLQKEHDSFLPSTLRKAPR